MPSAIALNVFATARTPACRFAPSPTCDDAVSSVFADFTIAYVLL